MASQEEKPPSDDVIVQTIKAYWRDLNKNAAYEYAIEKIDITMIGGFDAQRRAWFVRTDNTVIKMENAILAKLITQRWDCKDEGYWIYQKRNGEWTAGADTPTHYSRIDK